MTEFEVNIDRIVSGGYGMARYEGRTCFVPLAVPGDRLLVRESGRKGTVTFAEIVGILGPGANRVTPPCPYFGQCGGCDFQQLSYSQQLAAKRDALADSLRRIGGFKELPEFDVAPSPEPWAYRIRATWQRDPESGQVGYFARTSHEVVPVAECRVLVPKLQAEIQSINAAADDGSGLRGPGHIDVVVSGEELSIRTSDAPAPGSEIQIEVAGERYWLDASCFFQSNLGLLPELIDEALLGLGDVAGGLALDLYAGVGLFTIPIARRFTRVFAVEESKAAANFARRNLKAAGLEFAHVAPMPVGPWLRQRAKQLGRVQFVLVDPPRTGLDEITRAELGRIKPDRIAYVSCDPATLGRDLKTLVGHGYSIERIRGFDMFPQTHHVEAVVHLAKRARE